MAELESLLSAMPGLHLVGSAYHGVGLPDLIRQGRATARCSRATTPATVELTFDVATLELWQEQKETRQFHTCWNRLPSRRSTMVSVVKN